MYQWPANDEDLHKTFETLLSESKGDLLEIFKGQLKEQIEIHKFFAQLPQKMQAKGYPEKEDHRGLPYPLIITTKYDFWLEHALDNYANKNNGKQSYQTVYYDISDSSRKKGIEGDFVHLNNNRCRISEIKESYLKLPVRSYSDNSDNGSKLQPVIIRLSGNWDRGFVITNEYFYNLLRDLNKLPTTIKEILKESNLLFLGYSPNDYELQLMVEQLQKEDIIQQKSWFVHHQSLFGNLAQKIWEKRDTILIPIEFSLGEFIKRLQDTIDNKISSKISSR